MALTLRRFFEPKVTVMYPEVRLDVPHKFRGRLQLLYDEWGTLKCETCFQCAQACPIECIDMGGMDTRGRYHVHWGAPETYGERREESPCAGPAARSRTRPTSPFAAGRPRPSVDAILEEYDHDPARMLTILEATQAAYGYLPVAALKRISHATGAWYAMIYGTASYYAHLRFEPAAATEQAAAVDAHRPAEATYLARSTPRSAGTGAPAPRRGPDHDRPAADAGRLADASSSPGPTPPTRPTSMRPSPPARSKGCAGPSATSVRRRRSRRSPHPACAAGAAPATRPATSGGPRPRPRPPRRYVVANGYGADPASHTDRTLMACDPYAVVEGTAIAAFAIGASEAFIAVRAEDTEVIARLSAADRRGRPTPGFLGADVSGSGHDICVTVRPVQGAYMLGEETVLLKALEGKRGQPEQRPPHPAERGLFGMPTVVHNVQTLAAVPWIVREGADAFAATGTAGSPGHRPRPGPHARRQTASPRSRWARRCATSSRSAASCREGRSLQAVLVGGPSGGLLPPDALDTPYDFDPLRAAGAHVGSGSVVVVDDRTDLRRARRRADPLLLERGVRQDDPVPDRHQAPGRDRRRAARTACCVRPTTPARRATSPPTSWPPRCATTSAWPPSR